MSAVRSFGLFDATLSMSPWNTRKLRAFTRMPWLFSRSLYASAGHACPSTRYSPVPAAVMCREKTVSTPSSASYTSLTYAVRRSSLSARSNEYTRSRSAAPRSCADCTPSTNEMASMRLDLPLPFGPMMDVNCLNGPITWWPLYDLSRENRGRGRGIRSGKARAESTGATAGVVFLSGGSDGRARGVETRARISVETRVSARRGTYRGRT